MGEMGSLMGGRRKRMWKKEERSIRKYRVEVQILKSILAPKTHNLFSCFLLSLYSASFISTPCHRETELRYALNDESGTEPEEVSPGLQLVGVAHRERES